MRREPCGTKIQADPITQQMPLLMFRKADRRDRIRNRGYQLCGESGAAERVPPPGLHALPMADVVVRVQTPRLRTLFEPCDHIRSAFDIMFEDHERFARPPLSHGLPVRQRIARYVDPDCPVRSGINSRLIPLRERD